MENLLNERITSPPGLAKLALEKDVLDIKEKVKKNTEDIQKIESGGTVDTEIIQTMQNDINGLKSTSNTQGQAINNLAYEVTIMNDEVDNVKKSVSDGKKKVADAITGKGIETAADATFETMANSIKLIESGSSLDTEDGTITEDDVIEGKIGYAKGNKIVGSMPKVTSQNYSLPINGTYNVPKGYHDGTGKVTQAITNRGAVNATLGINGTYIIPEGYHNGQGKVTQDIPTLGSRIYFPETTDITISSGQYLTGSLTLKGSINLKKENIKNNVTIFGITGNLKLFDRNMGSTMKYVETSSLTLLNSSSFTIPYSGQIVMYEFRMNYEHPSMGQLSDTLCWAAPGVWGYFTSLMKAGPYICYDIYNQPFGTNGEYAQYSIYPPNVTITNNGRTFNWTWPRGKSSRINALGISYGYIPD